MKKILFAVALISFLTPQKARSFEPITTTIGMATATSIAWAIKNNKHC